ncbi:MAG: hypothetical protein C4586_08530 [Anaerolineaceae bacterium]|nr:MAG: hypothetical protein C4586_08530 [Anaerolineaceae bacterium]
MERGGHGFINIKKKLTPTHTLPILIHPPVTQYNSLIKHEAVDNEKAWEAVVILMALFDVGMFMRYLTHPIWQSIKRALYRWKIWGYRLRSWWRVKFGKEMELPF